MNCILLSDTNIYNLIHLNYLIHYLSNKYLLFYIFVEKKNIEFCKQFFYTIKNIKYLTKDNIIDFTIYINEFIKENNQKYNIIKLGSFHEKWKLLKDNIEIENMPINYFDIFYTQYKLDYVYFNIFYRNYKNEDTIYNKFKNIYTKKYIFTYKVNSLDILCYKDNLYDLYDPLININNNIKWILLDVDNIMDYLKIIINSSEIHINDLNMLLLLSLIDLNHIKNKFVYTKKIFLKSYFKELKDWNFIYN